MLLILPGGPAVPPRHDTVRRLLMIVMIAVALCCLGYLRFGWHRPAPHSEAAKRNKPVEDPPLIAAIKVGDRQRIMDLLQSGADVNVREPNGTTPLMWAARFADRSLVDVLLARGADIHAETNTGSCVLQVAAGGDHPDSVKRDIIKSLLDSGVNVNARNHYNRTALIIAAYRGDTKTVQLLLSRGADVNVVDGSTGKTALALAAEKGHTEIVSILKRAGAKN